ncbi:hypothetical protein [Nocardia nova]|nr:hypothetical protein [Nocardia nova]
MAVTSLGIGMVYVRFDAQHPRDLGTDPRGFTFGYEALANAEQFGSTVALDERMAECDLYAEVISGHYLAAALTPLCTAAVAEQVELVSVDNYAML